MPTRPLLALLLLGCGACGLALGLRDIEEGASPPSGAEGGGAGDGAPDDAVARDALPDRAAPLDAAEAGVDPCAAHADAYLCDSFEKGAILVPPWLREEQAGGLRMGSTKNRPGQKFHITSAFGPTPANGKAAIVFSPVPAGPKNKRALRFWTLQPVDGFPSVETPIAGLYDLTGNGVKVSQIGDGAGGYKFQVSDTQGSTPVVLGAVKQSDNGTTEANWQCIEIVVSISGDLSARLDGVTKTGAVAPALAASISRAEIGMSLKSYGGAGGNSQDVSFDDVVIASDTVGCD